MEKHFELTDNFIVNDHGIKLYQIKATRDSKHVEKGDLGGYVESLDNLCDEAWVGDNARVSGNARVSDNAIVHSSHIKDDVIIREKAEIYNSPWIGGDVEIYGEALISGRIRIIGKIKIGDNVKIYNDMFIGDGALIKSNEDYCFFDNIGGENYKFSAFKCSDGLIRIIHTNIDTYIFSGTLEEFEKDVIEKHADSKITKQYLAIIEVIKAKFEL